MMVPGSTTAHSNQTDSIPRDKLTSLSISKIRKEVVTRTDTLLLEYSLGEEQSFLWTISANSFNSYELPEGELIEKIQEVGFSYDGIILNAAAYTHTSVGIGDAVKAIVAPVVEVHISNTFSRESFRHISFIAPNARGVIVGFGLESYALAIQSFLK